MAINNIRVEIAYALPDIQILESLEVPFGATVQDVLDVATLNARFAHLDFNKVEIGIFGERCLRGDRVQAGDRIEIYRPLLVDPKERRRLKAKA